MNRFYLPVLFVLTGFCLRAQTFSTITIQTVPSGPTFYVDGQPYTNAATLVWPTGSKHIVSFLYNGGPNLPPNAQISNDGGSEYLFTGWVDNAGLLIPTSDPIQTVTADPRITTLTANLTVAYRLLLNFFNLPSSQSAGQVVCGSPGSNPSNQTLPGVVFIGGNCYINSVSIFEPAGSTLNLNAIPYPGFVFTGWLFNSGPLNTYLTSITVKGPTSITPVFAPGKRVHFLTNPLGMEVLVDHAMVPTRTTADVTTCQNNEYLGVATQYGVPPMCFGDFDFADGSKHIIGAPSPQTDRTGHYWVFDSFSDGLTANAIYTTTNISTPDTVTAKFDPGATATFNTNPPGLQLNIDGRQNWPSYNFVWALGSTHQVSAPSANFSSNGRQYTFQNWSNGASAAQTVTVDQNAVTTGIRVTANYSELSRVVIQSVPSGLTVQVDGTGCQTPCTLDRQSGVTMHVTAATQFPMGVGARLNFANWSDGGAADHTFPVNQDYTTLTVNYTNYYQLSATSNPAGGVSFQYSPASPDAFYSQNTQVNITAVPNPGFKFLQWGGALSGTYPSGTITMTAPQTVIAQMNAVPYIPPAGVMNAVGSTPNSAVAPGSIISIYGQGLASGLAIGPTNPLSQSIGGVTVTVNSSILGLLFVSPQQINAQVPSNLPAGQYTLSVQVTGQAPVTANFTVARDAPGLFFNTVNSQQYALALHADGSPVTSESPAAAGETISLLGTGFGPYSGTIVDGFFPPNPAPELADSLSITVGGQTPVPTWSGAAADFVGVALTNFQVPSGLPSGSNAALNVTINGVASNTVMLPIQ